ncbi:hypothetical protein VTI74DRAFT_9064 [Chaetomium olivicolor]
MDSKEPNNLHLVEPEVLDVKLRIGRLLHERLAASPQGIDKEDLREALLGACRPGGRSVCEWLAGLGAPYLVERHRLITMLHKTSRSLDPAGRSPDVADWLLIQEGIQGVRGWALEQIDTQGIIVASMGHYQVVNVIFRHKAMLNPSHVLDKGGIGLGTKIRGSYSRVKLAAACLSTGTGSATEPSSSSWPVADPRLRVPWKWSNSSLTPPAIAPETTSSTAGFQSPTCWPATASSRSQAWYAAPDSPDPRESAPPPSPPGWPSSKSSLNGEPRSTPSSNGASPSTALISGGGSPTAQILGNQAKSCGAPSSWKMTAKFAVFSAPKAPTLRRYQDGSLDGTSTPGSTTPSAPPSRAAYPRSCAQCLRLARCRAGTTPPRCATWRRRAARSMGIARCPNGCPRRAWKPCWT